MVLQKVYISMSTSVHFYLFTAYMALTMTGVINDKGAAF